MVEPAPDANSDEAALARAADRLAGGIEDALPRWVQRSVDRVYREWGGAPPPEVAAAADAAALDATADVAPRVRALLAADIDAQATTPLALLREAVRYPTRVLADTGVPAIERDPAAEAMFPQDVYGLTPASLADLDPGLAEAGIEWGAAKAWTHKRRHRRTVVAYVPDLMDRSKVAGAISGVEFVSDPAELPAAALIIVDLGRPGVLEVIPRLEGRVVGFGSHVDAETLRRAREAGAEALPRSAFFARLPNL